MIIPNEDKARSYEIPVWSVATGVPKLLKKRSRKAVNFIKDLKGFIAAYSDLPRGMLWLFDSKNNAIKAREEMDKVGIATGDNICEVFINKKYLKENK